MSNQIEWIAEKFSESIKNPDQYNKVCTIYIIKFKKKLYDNNILIKIFVVSRVCYKSRGPRKNVIDEYFIETS